MNLAQRKAITERQWLDSNGAAFADDQQGMLYAQLSDILRGSLDMSITEQHVAAYKAEADNLLEENKEFPF
jgi:hypothetical protein